MDEHSPHHLPHHTKDLHFKTLNLHLDLLKRPGQRAREIDRVVYALSGLAEEIAVVERSAPGHPPAGNRPYPVLQPQKPTALRHTRGYPYERERRISRSGMDAITGESGGECARIIGILRVKKAYLEETYHVGSIGIFGSCRRGGGARGERHGYPGRVLQGAGDLRVPRSLSTISPNFSGERWTRSRRARLNPVSAAVLQRRSSIYGGPAETYYAQLKCHDPSGDDYYVTFTRKTVRLSSYQDEAIRAKVEAWADTVTSLD